MPATSAPSLYTDYKSMIEAKKRLTFPLKGERNRPIYDFGGKLVSIPENAPLFVACVNLVHELSEFGLHGEVDGEIGGDQAIDTVVKWIQAAKAIMEQKR